MECTYCDCRIPADARVCLKCGMPPMRRDGFSSAIPVLECPQAQRRLLTILFCDLVGSTALAVRLDPEELHQMLVAYQRQAAKIVVAAGGLVARYAGDSILAYFGFPAADEDDAERAVRAGLELTARINDGNDLAHKFTVRIGIATGIVVVGTLRSNGADNPDVVGETPNLAARLQELAEPGTVVIASETRRQVGGLFEYRPMLRQKLKGFVRPVAAWQVLGESKPTYRFEALRSKYPLIGRDEESRRLLELWEIALGGQGQVAIISGEAGIGKSRLAFELISRIKRQFPMIRRYDCSPHSSGSMLYPLLAQLRQTALFDPADSTEAKFETLAALFAHIGDVSREVAAIIGDLMGFPASARFTPPRLDPHRKREFLFQALLGELETVARRRPMMLLVEDVQWMDATSRELLDRLIHRVPELSVLLVLTVRGDIECGWRQNDYVADISLGAIGARSAETLVRNIAGPERLLDAAVRNIVARADGIPLFLEELTRSALESGAVEAASAAPRPAASLTAIVPASLQASLMSRLDRLGHARQVAMVAAALGREFRLDVLQALLPDLGQQNLHGCLEELTNAELILPTGLHSEPTFAFRHALIQDAAYGTLVRGDRCALHGQIAQVLQQLTPETADMQPEVVARHFTNADLPEQAIEYWLKAGQRAAGRSALAEAVQHFSEGVRLAGALPPSQSRMRRQIDLHLALGAAMMAMKGYAASESREVFLNAEMFVNEAGYVSERMEVQLGLFNVHYGRAEINEALAVAKRHMALAGLHRTKLGRAHTLLGQIHASMGAFVRARRHFERAVDMFDHEPESTAELGTFSSHHVVALAFLAGLYFAFGEADLARHATTRSIEQAKASGHPMSIALALVTDLLTPIPGGLHPSSNRAEDVVRFCRQHGLANFEAWARFALGATAARRGNLRQGIDLMRAAIDAAEAMSSRLFRPTQLACLASAHAKLGEIEEAFNLVDKAIKLAERTGERQALAALYRAHAELLCAVGKPGDGEQCLARALDIARMQRAKAEEVRIEKSLAALARQQHG